MLENTDHKSSSGLIRRASRRLIAGFIVAALVSAIALPFTPDAYAKKKVPGLSVGIAATLPLDVMDFDPHYGQEPIPFWFTIPVLPVAPYYLPSIRFKTWCGPPIYVFGWCLPFPYNSWCNRFTQCMASNAVNLVATLLIKHAKPSTEGRLDKVIPAASPPDYYNRDACVNGSKLDFDKFDNKTGDLKADDVSKYGDSALGLLAGAKPLINTCASTINTPKFDPPVDAGKSFAYYQNANNDDFKAISGKDEDINKSIYGTSNGYLATTFPIEGALGCPKKVFDNDPELKDKPNTPELWKKKMEKCYDYFILSRATHPEWTLERPGISTDDPITQDSPKGNPELAIFDSCQPLMSGEDSRDFAAGIKSPAVSGALKFAPVFQYDRADLDEADYDIGKELERSYTQSFPTGVVGDAMPVFQNIFPCLEKKTDGGPSKKTHWAMFNAILMVNYFISAFVEKTVLGKNWGPQMFFPFLSAAMPEDIDYTSVGVGKAGFCPNVEKINVPTNPFAPRDNFKSKGETLADKALYYLFLRASPYIYNATLGLEPKATEYSTDRDYSYQTSFYTPSARVLQEKPKEIKIGYSKYTDNFQDGTFKPDQDKLLEHLVHPEVMCAIVPVDILESRRKAFDSCIMQRINYNFITWRRRNFLRYYYKYTLKKWKKPCATRFYESDNIKKCPMSMSIQQCCRIIVKDVVPMNYVKIRTCEGLRQKRSLIFGIDHIYDSAATTATNVEAQIGVAQDVLDKAEQQWEADLGAIIVGYPDLLTAYSAAADAMGDANDGDDKVAIATAQANLNAVYNNIIATTGNATLKADMDAILAAQKALADAENAPVTVVPVSSPNGLYFTVSDPTSYETALALNQKLALLGCDNTEPDDYRFSHYFHLSTWGDFGEHIPSKFITDGIAILQQGSDDAIMAARQEANRIANATASAAWATLEAARASSAVIINDAKKIELQAIENSQNAWNECTNAELRVTGLIDLKGALLSDPTGWLGAGTAYADKCIRARAYAAIAVAASKTFNTVKDLQDKILRDVQEGVRDTIQVALDTAENDFIINGKQTADKLIIEGMAELETVVQDKFPPAINAVYDKAMSNKMLKIGMMLLGEGGAHMPYMRWWDTGTSAGNPTRGGSFINTLGSYDTIVGVGHEERDFYDAGGTSSATGFNKLFDGLSLITGGTSLSDIMTLKGFPKNFGEFKGSITKSFTDFSGLVTKATSPGFITTKIRDAITEGSAGIGKAVTGVNNFVTTGTTSALNSLNDFGTKVSGTVASVESSMTTATTSVATKVTDLTAALGSASTNFTDAMGKVPAMINDPIANLAATDPAGALTTFTGITAITPGTTALTTKLTTDLGSTTNPTSTILNDVCGITYKKRATSDCSSRLTSSLSTFGTPGAAGVPDMAAMTADAAGLAVTNNTETLDKLYTSVTDIVKLPLPSLPSVGSLAPDGIAGTIFTSVVGSSFIASIDGFLSGVISSATTAVTSFVGSLTAPLTSGIAALKSAGTSLSTTIAGIAAGTSPPSTITAAVAAANAKASALVTMSTASLSTVTAALNTATIAYNANPTDSSVAAAYVTAKTEFDISTAVLKEAKEVEATIYDASTDAVNSVNRRTLAEAAVAAAAAMPTSTPAEVDAQLAALNAANADLMGAQTALDTEAAYIQDVFNKTTDQAQKEVDGMPSGVSTNVNNTVRGIITKATGANSPSQSLTERAKMGRIGGWGGLKGHQMWTTRRSNLSCIGRYEKLFKQGGPENFVLSRAGANYTSKAGVQWAWPLQWRGYVNDPNNEFEKNKIVGDGLGLAQKGDIIIYKAGGLKRIAYVTDVNQYEPYFVRIESWDQGKFPTVSGAGVAWGNKVERTIYKTEVPLSEQILNVRPSPMAAPVPTAINALTLSQVARNGVNPSCEDPGFKSCVLGGDNEYIVDDKIVKNDTWNDVIVYRPSLDTDSRQCPFLYTGDGNIQTDQKDTDTFSYCLNAGYDPPPQYVSNYRGVGTGSISDLSLCGAKWTGCTTVVKAADVKCFPGAVPPTGDVCTIAALPPGVPPAPPAVCTPAEYSAAKAAYDAEISAKQADLDAAEVNLDALDAVAAAAEYDALQVKANGRLTEGGEASAVMNNILSTIPPIDPIVVCVANAPTYCCGYDLLGACTGTCGGECIKTVITNTAEIAARDAERAPYLSALSGLDSASANLTATNDYLKDVYGKLKTFEIDHLAEIDLYEAYVASLDTDTPMAIDPSVIAAAEEYEALSAAIDPAIASDISAISAMESALDTAYDLGASPNAGVEAAIAAADAAALAADTASETGEDEVAAVTDTLGNVPPFKCPWP